MKTRRDFVRLPVLSVLLAGALFALTKAVATETDVRKRNAMIAEAMKIHQDDVGHIPLHQQALAWAMKKSVDLVQLADNYLFLKWVTVK